MRLRISLVISICLIILGFSFKVNNKYEKYIIEKKEIDSINNFIEKKDNELNYYAIIEIPKINLKRGINENDNVNKGIVILSNDINNIILASHSGNCDKCYFSSLDKLDVNDLIYFYYDNIKYIYKIDDITLKEKNTFKLDYLKDTITLITCSKNNENMNIIIIGKLISKENY